VIESFADEGLTITTYYPAPYGVYNQVEAKAGFAVGDISGIGTVGDLYTGELFISDGAIFKPKNVDPGAGDGKQGELIYNATEDTFKFFADGAWNNMIGGEVCYLSFCNGMVEDDCSFGGTPCIGGFTKLEPNDVYGFDPYCANCQYAFDINGQDIISSGRIYLCCK